MYTDVYGICVRTMYVCTLMYMIFDSNVKFNAGLINGPTMPRIVCGSRPFHAREIETFYQGGEVLFYFNIYFIILLMLSGSLFPLFL